MDRAGRIAGETAMARPASSHPTDGELEILQVLWESGPAGLGSICAALRRQRPLATTTVATMLGVMLGKGLVERRKGGRTYLWSAAVSRDAATRGLVGRLLDRIFDGSAERLVAHLVEAGRLGPHELAEVRRMIDARQSPTKQPSKKGGKGR